MDKKTENAGKIKQLHLPLSENVVGKLLGN